jgi:hypothetical protein
VTLAHVNRFIFLNLDFSRQINAIFKGPYHDRGRLFDIQFEFSIRSICFLSLILLILPVQIFMTPNWQCFPVILKKQEMKFGFKGIKQQNGVDFIHKLSYFASLSLKMRWKLVCWLA